MADTGRAGGGVIGQASEVLHCLNSSSHACYKKHLISGVWKLKIFFCFEINALKNRLKIRQFKEASRIQRFFLTDPNLCASLSTAFVDVLTLVAGNDILQRSARIANTA